MSTRCSVRLAALLALLLVPAAAAAQDVNALLNRALTSAARGQNREFLDAMRRAAALAPGHPFVLYHLARAHALGGERVEALRALESAAAIGIGADPAADRAFASLHADPDFAALLPRLRERAATVTASDTAFVVRTPRLIPENIATAPDGGWFIGDLLSRRILRLAVNGDLTEFAGAAVLRGGVVGMKPDPGRGLLWVNVIGDTTLLPPGERSRTPRSALLALDLTDGNLRHRFVPQDSFAPHLFNDLVITARGELLLTDSDAGAVYRVAAGLDSLEIWLPLASDSISYPNGIALDDSGDHLFVAHGEGVLMVDVATRRWQRIRPPAGYTLAGFDGLYQLDGTLVGIQNGGLRLDRVVAFRVDRNGSVAAIREIERAHPAYRVPTTGALRGDVLYYIANAQLDRMRTRDFDDPARPLDPIIVLKLAIPKL